MRQWELYGITDRAEASNRPAISDDPFPMVLWTTDHLLQFTSSPKPALGHLGLDVGHEAPSLLDLFGPGASAIDVIDAHLGALGGWPTQCDVRGPDRTFHCDVSPIRGPAGEIIGTICVARSELIEVAEVP